MYLTKQVLYYACAIADGGPQTRDMDVLAPTSQPLPGQEDAEEDRCVVCQGLRMFLGEIL